MIGNINLNGYSNNYSTNVPKPYMTPFEEKKEEEKKERMGIEDPVKKMQEEANPVKKEEEEKNPQTKAEKRATGECETCKNRKYQDGSDEMVSFKAAAHVSPQTAASAVMAHEQEHVANAYQKAGKAGGKVVQASVRIKTDVCPECGRVYVSGGETTTQIKYPGNDEYSKDMKGRDNARYSGMNFNGQS